MSDTKTFWLEGRCIEGVSIDAPSPTPIKGMVIDRYIHPQTQKLVYVVITGKEKEIKEILVGGTQKLKHTDDSEVFAF